MSRLRLHVLVACAACALVLAVLRIAAQSPPEGEVIWSLPLVPPIPGTYAARARGRVLGNGDGEQIVIPPLMPGGRLFLTGSAGSLLPMNVDDILHLCFVGRGTQACFDHDFAAKNGTTVPFGPVELTGRLVPGSYTLVWWVEDEYPPLFGVGAEGINLVHIALSSAATSPDTATPRVTASPTMTVTPTTIATLRPSITPTVTATSIPPLTATGTPSSTLSPTTTATPTASTTVTSATDARGGGDGMGGGDLRSSTRTILLATFGVGVGFSLLFALFKRRVYRRWSRPPQTRSVERPTLIPPSTRSRR